MSEVCDRVSVVLASRNGSPWIAAQLASVLGQTRPVDEVIVVDDASTDDTAAVVEGLAATRPGVVTLVRRPVALGVVGNFGDGLRRATGDVVFFCDQDDEWVPDKVARTLEAFDRHPLALAVFTDADLVDAASAPMGRRLWGSAGLDATALAAWARDPLGHLLLGNCVTGATLALRAAARDLVLPFPDCGYHDGWTALVLAAVRGPGSVVALPEPLVRYRLHGANTSGGLVPPGRLAGLLWYVRSGARAESIDLSQLPAAIERVRSLGADPSRLEDKLSFVRRRRTLPRNPLRRVGAVHGLREAYGRYTVGRLPRLLDALRG